MLVGRKANGRLAINERLFDKPMGLYAQGNSLYMSTRYQIWQLDNHLAKGETYQEADRLYVPSLSYTTGSLNVHDLVLGRDGTPIFINTDFSCLATIQAGYSFAPIWQPPFITKLVAEDRCHLNGLAMVEGEPAYVTACSMTDSAAGWRSHRNDGGIVVHLPSNEVVLRGLSMPHSPRWYQGKLWILNAGTGELGYVDDHQFRFWAIWWVLRSRNELLTRSSPEVHQKLTSYRRCWLYNEEAIAAYQRAIKLKPDFALAHQNLEGLLASQHT
jgi:uncharacterized protein (TIGR03032 family)